MPLQSNRLLVSLDVSLYLFTASQTCSDWILLVQQNIGTLSIFEFSDLSRLFFDYIVKLNLEVRGM